MADILGGLGGMFGAAGKGMMDMMVFKEQEAAQNRLEGFQKDQLDLQKRIADDENNNRYWDRRQRDHEFEVKTLFDMKRLFYDAEASITRMYNERAMQQAGFAHDKSMVGVQSEALKMMKLFDVEEYLPRVAGIEAQKDFSVQAGVGFLGLFARAGEPLLDTIYAKDTKPPERDEAIERFNDLMNNAMNIRVSLQGPMKQGDFFAYFKNPQKAQETVGWFDQFVGEYADQIGRIYRGSGDILKTIHGLGPGGVFDIPVPFKQALQGGSFLGRMGMNRAKTFYQSISDQFNSYLSGQTEASRERGAFFGGRGPTFGEK